MRAVAFATIPVRSDDPVEQETGSVGAVPELHPAPIHVDEVIGPPGAELASISLLSDK